MKSRNRKRYGPNSTTTCDFDTKWKKGKFDKTPHFLQSTKVLNIRRKQTLEDFRKKVKKLQNNLIRDNRPRGQKKTDFKTTDRINELYEMGKCKNKEYYEQCEILRYL